MPMLAADHRLLTPGIPYISGCLGPLQAMLQMNRTALWQYYAIFVSIKFVDLSGIEFTRLANAFPSGYFYL